jgi:hypothetical protein
LSDRFDGIKKQSKTKTSAPNKKHNQTVKFEMNAGPKRGRGGRGRGRGRGKKEKMSDDKLKEKLDSDLDTYFEQNKKEKKTEEKN